MPTLDDDSGSDREDELPQVVVLKGGDLTAEDLKKIKGATRAGAAEKGKSHQPALHGQYYPAKHCITLPTSKISLS